MDPDVILIPVYFPVAAAEPVEPWEHLLQVVPMLLGSGHLIFREEQGILFDSFCIPVYQWMVSCLHHLDFPPYASLKCLFRQ